MSVDEVCAVFLCFNNVPWQLGIVTVRFHFLTSFVSEFGIRNEDDVCKIRQRSCLDSGLRASDSTNDRNESIARLTISLLLPCFAVASGCTNPP